MNCNKAEEYLIDYLYQELPAKKTLEIEKHLHSCAKCAKTLESWRAIHRAYQRNAEEPQIAPYFKQKILAVAEEELARAPSWTERFGLGLKLATIPIAIFVIVLFLNNQNEKEIAMHKPQQQVTAPASKTEPARITRQLETPSARERKQDSTGYGGKRSEVDYATDKLQARPYDERLDKDVALKNKEEAAVSDAPAEGRIANEQPPAAPAASSPLRDAQQYGAQAEYEEQAKPEPTAAKKGRIAETADVSFRQAQQDLERSNMKGWQSNVQEAISLDDQRALASKLHQEGNTYQSRGEYGKAIPNFEQVQLNYRDYPQRDDVLLRLGDSYAEVGQFDKAVRAYQQVSPSQQKVAKDRIQRLQKKQEAQEQLRSLGYVSSDKDKE